MVYYTLRCPNCRMVLETSKGSIDKSGSPFMRCPRCGSICVNRDREEAARHDFKKPSFIPAILYSLLIAVLPTALFIVIADSNYQLNDNPYVIGIVYAIFAALLIIRAVKHRPTVIEKAQREWDASEARLNDTEYAKALKDAGYYIPKKYLEPDGIEEDTVMPGEKAGIIEHIKRLKSLYKRLNPASADVVIPIFSAAELFVKNQNDDDLEVNMRDGSVNAEFAALNAVHIFAMQRIKRTSAEEYIRQSITHERVDHALDLYNYINDLKLAKEYISQEEFSENQTLAISIAMNSPLV